jgi:prevent-host-death family protein
MRSANVADVKNRFSSYLRDVQKGDDIIVTSRGQAVALITSPPTEDGLSEHERRLVREGRMTLAKRKFDPVAFNKLPLPKGTGSVVEILLADREESY